MTQFNQITASRAVLIEVANVLGAFREHLVLVGGWVPELLYPGRGHMGSLDVDIAVAPTALADNAYETILRRMLDAGYAQQIAPTHFLKAVAGAPEPVKVDLISGQGQDGGMSASIQVNELLINCLRGIDLAFTAFDEIKVSGLMPDGAENVVRVQIVRPEVFILIKAFALDERAKEKDAYDVAFVLQNYQPTLAPLGERVQHLLANRLALAGYQILQAKFASIESVGPVWAARVSQTQGRDYQQAQRAAFENAQELFRIVNLET